MPNQDDDHPVAWLLIRFGWKVIGADGEQIGRIWHVRADRGRDIFNGFTYVSGLSLPKYVPAEDIAEIRRGVVELKPGAPAR
ncbi:MAG TPA: hypothetical protein VLJ76_05025 [Gaiellaceae bacterium]|nr:hypothetical protein [Gaiellaceae bacterium]